MKYTLDNLQHLKGCRSIREALGKLGLSPNGGHKELRKLIKEIICTEDSYLGKSIHKNRNIDKLSIEEYFSKSTKIRTSFKVRNKLFKLGLKEKKCERCNNTHWLGNLIPLEVHHIDGDTFNNELENLQILCPNCHYFTDTYKSKNIKLC